MNRPTLADHQAGSSIAFALVPQSTNKALTTDVLRTIAAAVESQLNNEFSLEWGGRYIMRVATNALNVGAAEVPIYLVDKLADPSDLGYHALNTATGMAVAYIAVPPGSDFTASPTALSVVISHEALETAADPGANRWADTNRGTMLAIEVCDEVEDTTYVGLGGVHVSNFLFQSYFVPGAHGPYDHMGVLTRQGEETPGGYSISVTTPMQPPVAAIIAKQLRQLPQYPPHALGAAAVGGPTSARVAFVSRPLTDAQLARRSHPSSRAYRRGVRLMPPAERAVLLPA